MPSDKYLIIYDGANNDSMATAALLKYAYNEKGITNIESININTIDELPLNSEYYKRNNIKTLGICECNLSKIEFNALYDIFKTDLIVILSNPIIVNKAKKIHNYVFGKMSVDRGAIMNLYTMLYDSLDIMYTKSLNNISDESLSIPLEFLYLSAYSSFNCNNIIADEKGNKLQYELVRNYNTGLTNMLINESTTKGIHVFSVMYNYIKYIMDKKNNSEGTIDTIDNYDINNICTLGESYNSIEDNNTTALIQAYADNTWICDNTRSAIALFTPNEVGENIIYNEEVKKYDTLLLFNRLKNSNWYLRIYKVIHYITIVDEENLTDDEKQVLFTNMFDCGSYLYSKYLGGGNDYYAHAEIKEKDFINMLKTKSV